MELVLFRQQTCQTSICHTVSGKYYLQRQSTRLIVLEDTDVIPYPLFLVLCDALGNPGNVADFLKDFCQPMNLGARHCVDKGIPAPLT
jgi:hypothetical protein